MLGPNSLLNLDNTYRDCKKANEHKIILADMLPKNKYKELISGAISRNLTPITIKLPLQIEDMTFFMVFPFHKFLSLDNTPPV